MVDCTNGAISHKYLGLAKMNSNWACDPEEMRMLVVGDVGRAVLFDISMGANQAIQQDKKRNDKNKMKNRSPPRARGKNSKEIKWEISRNWFVAHNIHKMEPFYVVTVKFVNIAKLFVSGTTHGEVKLWENQSLNCLGILNAVDWDPRDILQHINHVKKLENLK